MTEIEQLRQDIATLETAERLAGGMPGRSHVAGAISSIVYDKRAELAKLEAEAAAKADPWEETKQELRRHIENRVTAGLPVSRAANYTIYLEQRVAELEKQLASEKQRREDESSINNALSNDLDYFGKRIAELEAQLTKRPVVYCLRHRDYGFMLLLGETQIFPTKVSAELAKREDWIVEPYTGEWK